MKYKINLYDILKITFIWVLITFSLSWSCQNKIIKNNFTFVAKSIQPMKKNLIEAIKAKFVGIDDNTADRLAQRLIRKGDPITNEDEVAAAVATITLADVLKSVSDFSADDAKKRYETKYGLKDGVPVKKEDDDDPDGGGTDPQKKKDPQGAEDPLKEAKAAFAEMLKGFSSKLETMGADIAAIKTGKLTETRKSRVEQIVKDLRDSQKKSYLRYPFDKMSDEEFDNHLTEVQTEVNEILAEDKAAGSVVSAPLGVRHEPAGKVKEATKDEMDTLLGKFNLPTN